MRAAWHRKLHLMKPPSAVLRTRDYLVTALECHLGLKPTQVKPQPIYHSHRDQDQTECNGGWGLWKDWAGQAVLAYHGYCSLDTSFMRSLSLSLTCALSHTVLKHLRAGPADDSEG